MAEETHSDISMKWLIFFFVCFVIVMAIGAVAIFTYNANAPEPAPTSAHGGMILPQDGEYARHAQVWPVA